VITSERIFKFVRFCTVGGTVALIDFSMVFIFSPISATSRRRNNRLFYWGYLPFSAQ